MQAEIIHNERRAHRRYRVGLELAYRLPDGKGGTATALEMSSGGMLLDAGTPLPLHREVGMVIEWPIRLQAICALELVVIGTTVRTAGRCTAVRIGSYQFRARPFQQPEIATRRVLEVA